MKVLAGKILSAGAFFVWGMMMARILGPGGQGILSVVIAFSTFILMIFSMGAGEAVLYMHGSNRFNRQESAGFVIFASFLTGITGLLAGLGIVFSHPSFLRNTPEWALITGVVAVPLILFAEHTMVLMVGAGKTSVFPILSAARGGSMLAVAIILVFVSGQGTAELGTGIFSWIAGVVIAMSIAVPVLIRWSGGVKPPAPAKLVEAFSYGITGAAARISGFLVLRADLFIVNFFLGASSAGLYSIAALGAETLRHLPAASGLNLFSRVAAGSRKKFTISILVFNFMVTSFLAVVIAIFSGPLMELFFGPQYSGSVNPMRWLLLGMPAYASSGILANHFLGKGMPSRNLAGALVTLLINTVLDFILVPISGIEGAGIASAAAYWIGGIFMFLMFFGTKDSKEVGSTSEI